MGEDAETWIPPQRAFSVARVDTPTVPVPFERPFGPRISLKYFSWNFTTATFVFAPKVVDSLPGDPTPETATCVAGSVFRNCWRRRTSGPELPVFRLVFHANGQGVVAALATFAARATVKSTAIATGRHWRTAASIGTR